MKQLLSVAIVLAVAAAAWGTPMLPGTAPAGNRGWSALNPWAQSAPHPAVVRVIAPERGSMSLGSGALVAVNQTHGLVVTNWHVVCEATGQVVVVFPDGFRSPARVLRLDRDWDLAALVIHRPNVEPIRLAQDAPRRGEPLTIAGYGSNSYRAATGRCTQYVSPGANKPFEMVEVSAAARQGDSGGPILNSRGELAGVLFGTAWGRTTGSYCGRVRAFLAPLGNDFPQLLPAGRMLAGPAPVGPPASTDNPLSAPPPQETPLPYAAIGAGQAGAAEAGAPEQAAAPPADWSASPAARSPHRLAPSPGDTVTTPPADPTGTYRIDQIKNILAAVGAVALLFHSLRLVSMLQG